MRFWTPLLYSLLAASLFSAGCYFGFAQGALTFARTSEPPFSSRPDVDSLITGQPYEVKCASDFSQTGASPGYLNLPELEFDLPPFEQDYLLIVGCLQGDLQQNSFSLELQKQANNKPVRSMGTCHFIPLPAYRSTTVEPTEEARVIVEKEPSLTDPQSETGNFCFYETSDEKRRVFSLYVGNGLFGSEQAYEECETRLLSEGSHLRLWLDIKDELTTEKLSSTELKNQWKERATHLHSCFEKLVVSTLAPWLGEVNDLDGDGKFSIVLTSRLNQLSKGTEPLVGLTWSGDYRRDLPRPYGNRADVVYLNPTINDEELVTEVLVHEYVHALSFDLHLETMTSSQNARYEEDWLNEGLAHLVETELTGTRRNIEDRLQAFLSQPGNFPLVVSDYNRAGLWRSPGCRGATFSFLSWCKAQKRKRFIPQLFHSSSTGLQGVADATGDSFPNLFRGWSSAVALETTQITSLEPGEAYQWKQAATSCHFFRISQREGEQARVKLKNESESGIQLTLIPLSDPKAEEALISGN
ncbi:MAG: hypothetical protein KDA65_00605 [Planctomycetaceae bacterium]|nr:hypothetical protein [Planctomycetaceae bacterium]